jgi:enoyl-CoA hydratase
MNTGTEQLLARVDGAIGTLTFHRPERHNAVSLEMWRALPDVLQAFDDDPKVRVLVVTGAGERAFVAGADISEFDSARADSDSNDRYDDVSRAALQALASLQKPVIAMIRGFCMGAGVAISLSCDLRFCSDDAKFAIPAAKLGLGYRFDGVQALARVVGPTFASEILFTARRFDALEARRMSLVNHVVAASELEDAVLYTAHQIADNAPLTVRASKLALRGAFGRPSDDERAAIDDAIEACFESADYAEGRRAFRDKRKPRFSGR